MAFFEPLPEEPQRPTPAPAPRLVPPWKGPPHDVLPGVVALELSLVRSDRQQIWIGSVEAYPVGLALTVLMAGRRPAPEGVESGRGTWRFGVQFSDGRKATADGIGGGLRASRALLASEVPPDGPILRAGGGSGSRQAFRQQYWLWPLPPAGDVLLACEWPDLNIPFSTATVGSAPLLEAAARARPMWPAGS